MAGVPAWLRNGMGTLLGLILAAIVIATVEEFVRPPRGVDDSAPFLVALLGYALGTFLGATLAARIARHGRIAAVVVAVVLAALAVIDVASFAHPSWFVMAPPVAIDTAIKPFAHPSWFLPLAIAIFVLAGWCGARLTPRDRWPGHRVR